MPEFVFTSGSGLPWLSQHPSRGTAVTSRSRCVFPPSVKAVSSGQGAEEQRRSAVRCQKTGNAISMLSSVCCRCNSSSRKKTNLLVLLHSDHWTSVCSGTKTRPNYKVSVCSCVDFIGVTRHQNFSDLVIQFECGKKENMCTQAQSSQS